MSGYLYSAEHKGIGWHRSRGHWIRGRDVKVLEGIGVGDTGLKVGT